MFDALARGAALAFAMVSLTACGSLLGANFDKQPQDEGKQPSATEPTSTEPTSGEEQTNESAPDGGGSPAKDGSTATKGSKCSGKAQACTDLDTSGLCGGQKGCTWTTPKCTGKATNCATFDPNVCSIRRPACDFDFDTRQCYPTTSWCPSASDENECSQQNGCTWTGGCAGSVTACDAFSMAECTKQRGCVVTEQ